MSLSDLLGPSSGQSSGTLAALLGPSPGSAKPGLFSAVDSSGNSFGFSDQKDTSGKPFFAYRAPGDTSTTTDLTRVATSFDPRVATPQSSASFLNPRAVASRAALKTAMGGSYNTELDHIIALELSGSNNPKNLQIEPSVDPSKPYSSTNQTATDPLENQLAKQVSTGQMSLFDAQTKLAAAKGVAAPFTGQQHSWLDNIIEGIKTGASDVGNFLGNAFGVQSAHAAAPSVTKTIETQPTSILASLRASTPDVSGNNNPLNLSTTNGTANTTPIAHTTQDTASKVFDFFFRPDPTLKFQPAFTLPSQAYTSDTLPATPAIATAYNIFNRTPEFFAEVIPKIAAVLFPNQQIPTLGINAGRLGGVEGEKTLQTWGQDYVDQWAKADIASGISPDKAVDASNPLSVFNGILPAIQSVIFPALGAADIAAGVTSAAKSVMSATGYSAEATQSLRNLGIHPDELRTSSGPEARNLIQSQAAEQAKQIILANKNEITGALAAKEKVPQAIIDELNKVSRDANTVLNEHFGSTPSKGPVTARPITDAEGKVTYQTPTPSAQGPVKAVAGGEITPLGNSLRRIADALTSPIGDLGKIAPLRLAPPENTQALPGERVVPGQAHPFGASMQAVENVGGEYPEKPAGNGEPQTFYRGGGEGSMPSGTAADIIQYEKQELGNTDVTPTEGIDLSKIPAKNTVWLTSTKEAAQEYGKPQSVSFPVGSYRIIARDGQGGVLIEKGITPTGTPKNFTPDQKTPAKLNQAYRQLSRDSESLALAKANPEMHAKAYGSGRMAELEANIAKAKATIKELTPPLPSPKEVPQTAPKAETAASPVGQGSGIRVSAQEAGMGTRALNKATAAENKPNLEATANEKKLQELLTQHSVLKEMNANDKAKGLIPYIDPKTGILPEVTGKGTPRYYQCYIAGKS